MSRFALILSALLAVGCGHMLADEWRPFGSMFASARTTAPSRKRAPVEETEPAPIPPVPPAPIPTPPLPPLPPTPTPVAPFLNLPDSIEGDVGSFIKVKADTNGNHVRWVAIDKGLAVFPGEMLKDSLSTVVMSATAGQYRLLAYTALGDMPTDPVTTMIVVHGPQPPPVPPVPPVPPPVPVPPVTATSLWIVTVDDVTARSPAMAAILNDMGLWQGLQNAGHQVRHYNITDPEAGKYAGQVAANGGLPVVVLMDTKTAKWLNKEPADLKFPATSDGFRQLISKYSGK